jgi:hypothetical protein
MKTDAKPPYFCVTVAVMVGPGVSVALVGVTVALRSMVGVTVSVGEGLAPIMVGVDVKVGVGSVGVIVGVIVGVTTLVGGGTVGVINMANNSGGIAEQAARVKHRVRASIFFIRGLF